MAKEEPGRDPIGEDSRLKSLDQRLKAAEQAEAVRTGGDKRPEADQNYRLGSRVLAELIGGIAGGALVGWVLDLWLGTKPWLLLAVMFLGIIASFRNIMKISTERPKQ